MRLRNLTITAFKNLRNLHVDFDMESPYTVLVGENGAGKSNLIEALAIIFRDLDLDRVAAFAYTIRYRCRDHDIEISAEQDQYPKFRARTGSGSRYSDLPRSRFMMCDSEGRPSFRPAFVFGYYSGPSDRLSAIFDKHQERYYSWIIKPPDQRPAGPENVNALRRAFYARNLHGQFALIAFFMEPSAVDDDDRAFLRDYLQIDGLDSVLFVLKKPEWARGGGDQRFWGAVGEVQEFLSRLYDRAMLPIRMKRRVSVDLAKRSSVEHLYLFLSRAQELERVYQSYGDQYLFFSALESMHLSNLLSEVRTRIRMAPGAGEGEMTYRDLSEGEQQLLLVLGLLKFTAQDEALFLLDEPDTHLNPAWSTQYLAFLNRFIRGRYTCHIVMASHDPLVFAGLKRDQVRIIRRGDEGQALAEAPERDPRGMGIAAILTSDLFRLRSTLDSHTQDALDRQLLLSMKQRLDATELAELSELRIRLKDLGFTQASRDPLYEQFVRAWSEQADPEWTQVMQLTPEQQHARAKLSAEIVARLRKSRNR